jgi:hypothetical protein
MEPGKIRDQLVCHRRRHRIECIRPIEGEDLGRVLLFDSDSREFVHLVSFPGSDPGWQNVMVAR